VRAEVPDAVAVCKRAGITVRMVTGDNTYTAQHIARECGILSEGGIALEGPDFRNRSDEELKEVLPKVQVLARSSPADKFKLVHLLKEMGEVVAVTGDGTNDAPALKESDVVLAMGIAGTEVAKEAADIVILDDNFRSIVKAVLWGRSVFNNIRKFLMFQLTVNFVALVVAFVAAVGSGETPLNVLQLLWVNLIMDSLAALALATEAPTPELLEEKPHGRNEPLINGAMWRQIVGQVFYQITVLFLIIYGAPQYIDVYSLPTACPTYSAVDASGIDISAINATGGSVLYNPVVPAPSATYSEQKARCWKGPCVNLCCNTNAQGYCTDNLVSDGGHYYPNEFPVCAFSGLDRVGARKCDIKRARRNKANFCPPGQNSCARANQFEKLDNQANHQYVADVDHTQRDFNSIVFNTFIFLQIFNQFNARKIKDEYNIFGGILQSRMFIYVAVIILAFQMIIMFTVVRNFFKVDTIPWEGWLYSVLVGAGAFPVCLLIKVVVRNTNCARWWPKRKPKNIAEGAHSELAPRKWSSPKTWLKNPQGGTLPLPR
jgi:Ca2+-transporting ATPase